MGYPDLTFRAELDPVTRKELELFTSQLEGFLRSAGFNADGSFTTINANTVNATNINIQNIADAGTCVLIIASRTLTDAQIKSLPTTPVELRLVDGSTSAPGNGFVCNLVKYAWTLDTRAGAYAGMNGAELRIVTGSVIQGNTPPLDQFLGNPGVWTGLSEPLATAVPGPGFDASLANNQALFVGLENNAALTGGHASNFLNVTAYYVITPISAAASSSALNWTTTGQLVAPSAADGVSVTPSGSDLGYSGWVEVSASTASDWLLTGVMVRPGVGSCTFYVEVGIGTAGNEVAVACHFGRSDSLAALGNGYLLWPIPIDAIPSGSRVSVRMRKTGTDVTAWIFALTYLPKPAAGNVDVTTQVPTIFTPSMPPMDPANTDWATSPWEVQGTAATSYLVWGFMVDGDANSEHELDLAVGPAGNEQLITTWRTSTDANSGAASGGGFKWIPFKPVLDNISIGQVISTRLRREGTAAAVWYPHLMVSPTTGTPYALTTRQAASALPSAQAGISASTAGVAWNNGNWVQVTPDLYDDIAILGVGYQSDSGGSYEIDIGRGAAGSEVVVGTFRLESQGATSGNQTHFWFPYAIKVTGRSRLALRLRGSATSQPIQSGLTVIYQPAFDQKTSVACACYPSAAANVTIAGANSAWANSNWSELTPATSSDVFLYSIAFDPGVASVEFEIDLGTGAASSETVLTTVRSWVGSSAGSQTVIWLPVPVKVVSGTRVAARLRKQGTSTANWGIAVNYYGNVLA